MTDHSQPLSDTSPQQTAPAVFGNIPRVTAAPQQTPEVANARRLLLDPQAISERHDPGAWERSTQREVEVSLQIKELVANREAVGDDLRAQERHREELERSYRARSRGLVSRVYKLVGTDPVLRDIRESLHQKKRSTREMELSAKELDARIMEARAQLDTLPEPGATIDQYSREMSRRTLSREEKIELLRPEVLPYPLKSLFKYGDVLILISLLT